MALSLKAEINLRDDFGAWMEDYKHAVAKFQEGEVASKQDDIHERLSISRLIEARQPKIVATLVAFVDSFIADRTDMKVTTLAHYERGRRCLVGFFGKDKSLADITPHDADQFRSWLKGTKKHPENTARGYLKNFKLFFGAAVKAKLTVENLFKGLSSQLVRRPDRMAFVERDTINRILAVCPTSRWKAIVDLCRFGACGVRPKFSPYSGPISISREVGYESARPSVKGSARESSAKTSCYRSPPSLGRTLSGTGWRRVRN